MKTILVDAVDTFVIRGKGIYQEMFELLENYPNKKIIVTNASTEQIKEYGLVNLPYILFTLEHKPDKINPEYFRRLLEKFNLTSNEVIYFEHNSEAVESARIVGIASHHYQSDKQDLKALKDFLDKNL